jgi:hypothetical protein
VPENCLESSLTYRRMLAAAAWSKGTRQSWDRTVRPVLTDLAASVGLEHCHGPGASEPGRAELVRWVRAIEEATPSHDPRDRL